MKKGKLVVMILALVVFMLPLAQAGLVITNPDSNVYNFGRNIASSVTVRSDTNFDGFLKVKVKCTGAEVVYFVKPLNLQNQEQALIEVPMLKTFPLLNGSCYLESFMEDYSGSVMSSVYTNNFEVTDYLNITLETQKKWFNPEEEVLLTSFVRDAQNKKLLGGTAVVTFFDSQSNMDLLDGGFTRRLFLPKNIKSGNHTINVKVEDGLKNKATRNIDFSVNQIPTSINSDLGGSNFKPEEEVKVISKLFDQAGDEMEATGKMMIYDANSKKLGEMDIVTNQALNFKLEQYAIPGTYKVRVEIKGVGEENSFQVDEVRQIITVILDDEVVITNVGNVDYVGQVIVKFGGKEKVVDVNLKPSEEKRSQLNNGFGDVIVFAGNEERNLGQINISRPPSLPDITANLISSGANRVGEYAMNETVWVVLGIILIILIIILIKIKQWQEEMRATKSRERDYMEGRRKITRINEDREKRRNSGHRRIFPFAEPVKEEDAKDFRESMLKNMEDDKRMKEKKTGIFTRDEKTRARQASSYDEGYRVMPAKPREEIRPREEPKSYYSDYTQERQEEKKKSEDKTGGFFSMFS